MPSTCCIPRETPTSGNGGGFGEFCATASSVAATLLAAASAGRSTASPYPFPLRNRMYSVHAGVSVCTTWFRAQRTCPVAKKGCVMLSLTVLSAASGTAREKEEEEEEEEEEERRGEEVPFAPSPAAAPFFVSPFRDAARGGTTPAGGCSAELSRSHAGILSLRSSSRVHGPTAPGCGASFGSGRARPSSLPSSSRYLFFCFGKEGGGEKRERERKGERKEREGERKGGREKLFRERGKRRGAGRERERERGRKKKRRRRKKERKEKTHKTLSHLSTAYPFGAPALKCGAAVTQCTLPGSLDASSTTPILWARLTSTQAPWPVPGRLAETSNGSTGAPSAETTVTLSCPPKQRLASVRLPTLSSLNRYLFPAETVKLVREQPGFEGTAKALCLLRPGGMLPTGSGEHVVELSVGPPRAQSWNTPRPLMSTDCGRSTQP